MVTVVSVKASQPHAFLRTQATKAPDTPKPEEYAAGESGQVKNAGMLSSQFSKPATVTGDAFSALLKAQETFATQNTRPNAATSSSSFTAHTIGGEVDLDEEFSNDPPPVTKHLSLAEAAQNLILPTAENVKAITAHVNKRFQELLKSYNIAEAPAQITYDKMGQMQLPANYPHKDELKQALSDNPGFALELSSLNAIASHAAGLKRAIAFNQEYSQASSQAQANALIAKYSDLFSGQHKGGGAYRSEFLC